MRPIITAAIVLILSLIAGIPGTSCCVADANTPLRPAHQDPNAPVNAILDRLQARTDDLSSYQCKLDYVFRQPWLESQSRRQGTLYYARIAERSCLRIDFQTLQQDEEAERPYRQQFFFDGIWLWRIDYPMQHAERRQISEPNEPIDAFALASRNVPVLGFSNVDNIREQFEPEYIAPVDPNATAGKTDHLHLKVKPDSAYKDDYVSMDLVIDRELNLPVEITAVNLDEDIYEIKLVDPKVDESIGESTFEPEIPSSFSIETIPLDREPTPQ
jgi:outer membrane lipoprotein-sorting protein